MRAARSFWYISKLSPERSRWLFRWRHTRRSEWKRVGDSTILPLLRETSGHRELIAVWAGRSATGCWLNAGDDGLRQLLFVAGFRRGMSELCRAGNEMPVHRVGTVSSRGHATNAGHWEAEWCDPTVAPRKSAELQRSEPTGACQGDDWIHRTTPNSSSRLNNLTYR